MADGYEYSGSYRIRAGTWAANQLDSSYEVGVLPRQDDQPNIVDWLEPLEGSDVYRDFAEINISMDGTGKTLGEGSVTWFSSYWTPFMVSYFIDTYPPGEYTIMTFDAGAGWIVVNCTLQPIDKTQGQRVGTGYKSIPIRFVAATEAPAGFGFTSGFSNGFDAPG